MFTPCRVARLHEKISQTFNNALCFPIYLSFVSVVFVTALMTIWQISSFTDLASLVYTMPVKFKNVTKLFGLRLHDASRKMV